MKWVAVILTALIVSACGGAKKVQSSVTVTEYIIKERVVHDTVPIMKEEAQKKQRMPWWNRLVWPLAFIVSFISVVALWLKRLMK